MGIKNITRHHVLTVITLLAVWLGVMGVGGPYFGRIEEVSSNDPATFLPKSAESTKVNEQLAAFRSSNAIPVIAVFTNDNGQRISPAQQNAITAAGANLKEVTGVAGDVSPAILSEDGKAVIVVAPLKSDSELKQVFPAIKTSLDGANTGASYKLAGPASFARDLQSAFGAIDVTLLLVALGAVFVILLLVYRSPLLPFMVLIAAMGALTAAIFVVWHMAKAGILQLNGQTQGILFILVIGAATDYSLLYIARLREEYHNEQSKWLATKAALKGSFEPILAAGGTVIVGLLCLLLSDLGSNKALGPIGGIGIAFAILSALTFLPAMLYVAGRSAFWPKRPEYDVKHVETYETRHPFWAKVGNLVRRHPRRVWATSLATLLIASLGFFQLKADGVSQSALVLGKSEARDAQKILDEHFPGGSGSPTYLLVPMQNKDAVIAALDTNKDIATVSITATGAPGDATLAGKSYQEFTQRLKAGFRERLAKDPTFAALDAAAQNEMIAKLSAKSDPYANATNKVVDGTVLLQATLKQAANSDAARQAIVGIRDEAKRINPAIMVGGTSAVQYDTVQASIRDRTVIIPTVLLAVTLILIALLRSVVAPLLLLFTTVVSFGATLGISALLFNHLWKFPGADPSVVLFGFVFLVALGIDYNIFLMTRVREESMKRGTADGVIKGLIVTGGVITSAGVVLAATFAALGIIPILFLAQLAFVVTFGVLLDTIIVRSLLVPALTLEIGRRVWWPSRLSRK